MILLEGPVDWVIGARILWAVEVRFLGVNLDDMIGGDIFGEEWDDVEW